MLIPALSVVAGLAVLVWGADRFVDGASGAARLLGVPALLIGILIMGFGTSAPELVVSAQAALAGNPGLALGNAYGSNISNIALILGTTALMAPIAVKSGVLRREFPVLLAVTVLAAWQLADGMLSRWDGIVLLVVFFLLVGWTVIGSMRTNIEIMEEEVDIKEMTPGKAALWLLVGLVGLVAGSRLLVSGAVEIAAALGVSDLVVGLTIVAIGTSLPELAASIVATRRGEHEMALGNVIGSNIFNTLAVVGIAATVHPLSVEPVVLERDVLFMGALTVSLFFVGYRHRSDGRINRVEGFLLFAAYVAYLVWVIRTA